MMPPKKLLIDGESESGSPSEFSYDAPSSRSSEAVLPPNKRKREQADYVAQNARRILQKAGVTEAKHPHGSVDTSNVHHVISGSSDADASLPNTAGSSSVSSKDIYKEFAVQNAVLSSKHHYVHEEHATTDQDDKTQKADSMSSFTDTESNDEEEEPRSVATVVKSNHKAPRPEKARVITTAQEPFAIVYANDLFTKLTGYCPLRTLGSDLADFCPGSQEVFQRVSQSLNCAHVHDLKLKTKAEYRRRRYPTCTMYISPVQSNGSATHLLLDVEVTDNGDDAASVVG